MSQITLPLRASAVLLGTSLYLLAAKQSVDADRTRRRSCLARADSDPID